MKKEKQQELIKYIQKEIPEIMKSYSVAEIFGESGSLTDKRQLYKAKIFYGRPITLEDVLRVMSNIPLLEIEFQGDCKLKFRLGFGIIKEPTNWVFWNLEKDFNNQSEEFILWLYDLLIKKV